MKAQLLDKNHSALEARLTPPRWNGRVRGACRASRRSGGGRIAQGAGCRSSVRFRCVGDFGSSRRRTGRHRRRWRFGRALRHARRSGKPSSDGNAERQAGCRAAGLCAFTPSSTDSISCCGDCSPDCRSPAPTFPEWASVGCSPIFPAGRNRANSRPATLRAPKIAAIVLAAGTSSRMGANKLTADWQGKPIVRRTGRSRARQPRDWRSRGHRPTMRTSCGATWQDCPWRSSITQTIPRA